MVNKEVSHSNSVKSVRTESKTMAYKQETSIEVLRLDEGKVFADGGLKAYSVVAGCCFGLIAAFGVMNSVGAIQAYVSTHQLQSLEASTVSWIFGLYVFTTFAASILSGCYFDRNGCGTSKWIGCALAIVGVFCLAECKKLYQFILCLSILYGVGSGILLTCYVSCVASWFKEKRAHAQSIAGIGGSVGGIVFPVMLRKLYSQVGYAWAIRTLAFIVSACMAISMLLIQENAAVMNYQSKTLPWKETFRLYVRYGVDLRFLKDKKFVCCALGCCFAENATMVIATYFPSYALSTGVSESTSYTLITIINVAGILGRASGYLADRFVGRMMIITISLLVMTLLSLVMWLPFGHTLNVLYVFSAIYGVFCSSILSLTPIAVGQICSIEEFGRRYSMIYLMTALMSLPVFPVAGVIIGKGSSRNYNMFIVYCSILTFAGACLYTATRFLSIGLSKRKF
ncbi:LAME_0D09054g1_1 [Lachancea meyersii CBS 8951]|uniref:LAME_0D09054g1_1 n=1 Tax=Lachancea meyersii CBS 8951 TaxID=1266667 RepID=A0A1G4JB45_9SACH|nr:LAME_0D09054g1_1 [Lachancea meyersii CBS 8951]